MMVRVLMVMVMMWMMMLIGGVSPKREMVGRLWLIDPVNHGADRTLCIKHYKLCFVQCTLQYTKIEYFHWNGNTTYTTKGHKIESKIKCTNWTSQSRDTAKRCFFVLWQHWHFTLFIRILCSFVQERVRLRGRGQSYDMDWGVARATRHVEIVPLPTWHTYTVTNIHIHVHIYYKHLQNILILILGLCPQPGIFFGNLNLLQDQWSMMINEILWWV